MNGIALEFATEIRTLTKDLRGSKGDIVVDTIMAIDQLPKHQGWKLLGIVLDMADASSELKYKIYSQYEQFVEAIRNNRLEFSRVIFAHDEFSRC